MLGLNQDLIVILVVAGVIFGAKRLPDIGKSLGEGIKEFKDGLYGREEEKPSSPKEIENTPVNKQNEKE